MKRSGNVNVEESTIDFSFLNVITDENDRNHIIDQLNYAIKYLGDKFNIPFLSWLMLHC